ncbi:MAG: anti-sigma factor [Rhodoferax sp.]|nr:anti-sigma factor [Rhodoferax sp.]
MDSNASNTPPASSPPGYWRAATIFLLLVLAIAGTAGWSMFEQFSAQVRDLQQKVQKTAQLQYVAVLLDDKGEPALLVTQVSGEAALQVQRLNAVVEGGDDSMQLWAVPASGPAQSLGVLQAKLKTVRVPADEQTLAQLPNLAISVENRGGVTQAQGPRLPYLFTGRVIRKAI